TVNSGLRLAPRVAQAPPLLRTAMSLITGAPLSIARRRRSSSLRSPSQVRVRTLWSDEAVRPAGGLYPEGVQGCALSSTAAALTITAMRLIRFFISFALSFIRHRLTPVLQNQHRQECLYYGHKLSK